MPSVLFAVALPVCGVALLDTILTTAYLQNSPVALPVCGVALLDRHSFSATLDVDVLHMPGGVALLVCVGALQERHSISASAGLDMLQMPGAVVAMYTRLLVPLAGVTEAAEAERAQLRRIPGVVRAPDGVQCVEFTQAVPARGEVGFNPHEPPETFWRMVAHKSLRLKALHGRWVH